jgi:hypothetical protein
VDVEVLALHAAVVLLLAVVERACVETGRRLLVTPVLGLLDVGRCLVVDVPRVVHHLGEVLVIIDGRGNVVVVFQEFWQAHFVVTSASIHTMGFKCVEELGVDFGFRFLEAENSGVLLHAVGVFDV